MSADPGENKGYEACSGCGVCLLSCPIWFRTRTMSCTRKGRARAMQGGASYEEIAEAIDSCLLCGACEAVCPEGIGLVDLNIRQRQEFNSVRTSHPGWYPGSNDMPAYTIKAPTARILLLAGESLGSDNVVCGSVLGLLGDGSSAALAPDDGQDIAYLIEAGLPVAEERMEIFISSLRPARMLVVAEGLLHRLLRKRLPDKKIMGPGEALLSSGPLRKELGPEDLYVIESRGYHSDYNRLVLFYDRLRQERGCRMNLDLQRTASSTGASSLQGRKDMDASGCIENARRILNSKSLRRVVVEDMADVNVFRKATDLPVIHIGLLGRKGP